MSKKKKVFGGFRKAPSRPKVFVGVPIRMENGVLKPMAQDCLDAATKFGQESKTFDLAGRVHQGMSVSQNRYMLIKKFLHDPSFQDCTHFLTLDDDITYAPDAILKLLQVNAPVVAGCATWKTPPYWPNYNLFNASGSSSKVYLTEEMVTNGTVLEIDGAGTGFLLIKRVVLESVEKLWKTFTEKFIEKMPSRFHEWKPVPFFPVLFKDGDGFISTDFAFCGAVKEAGFPIYLHCGVIVGHIWETQISILDHFRWRDKFGASEEKQKYPLDEIDFVEYKSEDVSTGIALNG